MVLRVRARQWLAMALFGVMMIGVCACSSGNSSGAAPLPTATPGAVTVTIDRAAYGITEPIGVTVANTDGKHDFYAINGRSGCTYLQLQQYNTSKKTWLSVDGCTQVITAQPFLIKHGTSLPFTLPPGDAPGNRNQWMPGTYRIALQINTKADGSGNQQIIYSAGFQIQ